MKFKKDNFKQRNISRIITRNGLYFTVILIGIIVATYVGVLWYVQVSLPICRLDELIEKAPKMTDTNFIHMNKEYYLGKNGVISLLDGDGSTIYTNDVTAYSDFLASELRCIQEYNAKTSRHLTEFETLDGEKQYLLIEQIDTLNDIGKVQGYALFDHGYNILEGTLFPERKKLTQKEFSYLSGGTDNTYILRKYTYQNFLGDTRILVFTTQNTFTSKYLKTINYVIYWLFVLAIIVILLTLWYSFMIGKEIRRLILPVNRAIQNHKEGKQGEFEIHNEPNELSQIVDYFKELTDKINQCEWEKKYLDNSRKKLLADISHDLRTPITIIQGYAKALRDDLICEEEKRLYLDTIYNKSERLEELIRMFSEYSMIEHPDMPISLVKEDICSFTQVYFANKYEDLEMAGFSLNADIPEKSLFSKVDRVLLFRAIENLINNSLKYNPAGTTIYVRIEKDVNTIKLYIGDTGIGIPQDIIKELFEPFITGDSSRGAKHGTGLGLAIAKKIIALHHGTIDLVNPPQHNCETEYIIKLPLVN